MEFDILSSTSPSRRVDVKKLLKRKYDIRGQQAETARMRATTERRIGEQQYGPGGLVEEALAREHPYGVPEQKAATARFTAGSTAGYYGRMAGVAEKRQAGEVEQDKFAREFLSERGVLPSQTAAGGVSGDEVSRIKEIAQEEEEEPVVAPSRNRCARGYYWNGRNCVPDL